MFGQFDGQKVLVTGGAGGIGKGIVHAFAQCGAEVIIGDIDTASAEITAKSFCDQGYSVRSLLLDVTDMQSIRSFYDHAGLFSVLCSNCGIFPQKALLEMTEADWDRMQNVNLKSTFMVVQEGIRRLLPQEYGRIVLTSSITGPVTGYPGWAHYAATKAGMLGFMRSACLEVARKRNHHQRRHAGQHPDGRTGGAGPGLPRFHGPERACRAARNAGGYRFCRSLSGNPGSRLCDRTDHHRRRRADSARIAGCRYRVSDNDLLILLYGTATVAQPCPGSYPFRTVIRAFFAQVFFRCGIRVGILKVVLGVSVCNNAEFSHFYIQKVGR